MVAGGVWGRGFCGVNGKAGTSKGEGRVIAAVVIGGAAGTVRLAPAARPQPSAKKATNAHAAIFRFLPTTHFSTNARRETCGQSARVVEALATSAAPTTA